MPQIYIVQVTSRFVVRTLSYGMAIMWLNDPRIDPHSVTPMGHLGQVVLPDPEAEAKLRQWDQTPTVQDYGIAAGVPATLSEWSAAPWPARARMETGKAMVTP